MHLKIGAFQKNTLIDFPGVVASLVFTQGCNFRCPYCHNPSLIPGQPDSLQKTYPQTDTLIDPGEIFSFLKKRKGLIDGVTITGGEPTLQTGLEPFCFRLKNMGLKVKVDTNGSRPDVIENLIKRKLLDFIAMDIKSNQAGYKYLTGEQKSECFNFKMLSKSIRLIIKKAPAYEFRTTCIKPFISIEIMAEIGEMIRGASSYVLQHCSQNVNMLNPAFFQKNNPYPDPFFNDDELLELKDMVQGDVQNCSIR